MLEKIRTALDLIFPRNCQFCTEPLGDPEPGVICASCLGLVKRIEAPFCHRCSLPFAGQMDVQFECGYCQDIPFHFSRAVAACRAEGVVRDCIHRLKYNRELYYAPVLANWLIEAARENIDWREIDAVVPVPLHPRKKREREFNQAELLATALHKTFGVVVDQKNLRRVKDTISQTTLSAEERRCNLQKAFAVRRADAFKGKRLVILDDVFTTGATMNACAKALCESGAVNVTALAVARGV